MRKFDSKTYFKERRAVLKAMGICVDCQAAPAKTEPNKKPHVLCESCLKARSERERVRHLPRPLPFTGAFQL